MNITGISRKNSGYGRKFGYPTANIACAEALEEGVFVGRTTLITDNVKIENHPSIIFVGAAETVGESHKRLETHLFDIEDIDYYGAEISVTIEKKLRNSEHYESTALMIKQIEKDAKEAREYFGI